MKKRTQLIILSVLVFVAVVVVLSSSIFSFSEANVDYLTTKIKTNLNNNSKTTAKLNIIALNVTLKTSFFEIVNGILS